MIKGRLRKHGPAAGEWNTWDRGSGEVCNGFFCQSSRAGVQAPLDSCRRKGKGEENEPSAVGEDEV